MIARGRVEDMIAQQLAEIFVAVNAAEVEENVDVEKVLRIRGRDPVGEIPLPDGQRLTPLRIHRHHLAATERKTRFVERRANGLAELEKIGGHVSGIGFVDIGIQDGIVLISGQGLLAAAFAAEGEKYEIAGRRTRFLDREREHAPDRGVVDCRQRVRDVPHPGAAFDDHGH